MAVAPAGPGADPRGGRGKLSRFGQIIREHRVAQAAKARAAEEAAARARGVTRVVSEELTAALDPGDAVLVEFSCRKCPGFQVLRVDEEDLDFGVEAECGRCGRVKPVTRAELAERRLAVDEP